MNLQLYDTLHLDQAAGAVLWTHLNNNIFFFSLNYT